MQPGEHDRARAWREARGLSIGQLADLTGYSREAIYWFERGQASPNGRGQQPRRVSDWAWRRYKLVCAAVDAHLAGTARFDWKA